MIGLAPLIVDDADVRAVLETLDPGPRHTPTVLIRDEYDRDMIASQLLRYRDGRGDWADIIDMLTMYAGARRPVIRVMGEIDARRR